VAEIGQRQHAEAALIGGAHGRFDAAIGQEPGGGEVGDVALAEDEVDVCAGEAIDPALGLDYDLSGFGRDLGALATVGA
jgi:hypothetical protein